MHRTLVLKREALTELSDGALASVGAAAHGDALSYGWCPFTFAPVACVLVTYTYLCTSIVTCSA